MSQKRKRKKRKHSTVEAFMDKGELSYYKRKKTVGGEKNGRSRLG